MRRLSSQIFVSQVAILTATVLVGFGLFAYKERQQLDIQYEESAVAIAHAVADDPVISGCVAANGVGPDGSACYPDVQSLATKVQHETGASYVVVIDMNRIRHSHPKPELIGRHVSEGIVTSDTVAIDNGAAGRSAWGRVPMAGPDGGQAGEVSVGIPEERVNAALAGVLPGYALWFAAALGFGGIVSWLLARRLKKRTFGLELHEIAKLLQEREAVLHGIREGMIAFDPAGLITMINDEARRLLHIGQAAIGKRLEDVIPPSRLQDVLAGQAEGQGQDEIVLTDDHCLTVNRMPVFLAGRPAGAVVTLRDRTELSGLLRELDSVKGLTDALRAQQHEFSNRMHTVAGLLELGETDEALHFLTDLRGAEAAFAESVRSKIGSPVIVGLILAKAAVASERGIELELTADSWLGDGPAKVQALTTILGNLIDNAFDAVSGPGVAPGRPGRVLVSLAEDPDGTTVRVADNGPGVPAGAAESVFTDGFTTKPDTGTMRRGLGLALVHRLVQRLGGRVTVSEGPGAVFQVRLPSERAMVLTR